MWRVGWVGGWWGGGGGVGVAHHAQTEEWCSRRIGFPHQRTGLPHQSQVRKIVYEHAPQKP